MSKKKQEPIHPDSDRIEALTGLEAAIAEAGKHIPEGMPWSKLQDEMAVFIGNLETLRSDEAAAFECDICHEQIAEGLEWVTKYSPLEDAAEKLCIAYGHAASFNNFAGFLQPQPEEKAFTFYLACAECDRVVLIDFGHTLSNKPRFCPACGKMAVESSVTVKEE
ncbi:MAG: hypothetical protein PHT27_07665 [Candidatus Izemoplasmatales bacterium]|nr:hypothetical protein [Candidatus Izemoplasmatales bacterium]